MRELSSNPGLDDLEIYRLAEEVSDLVWGEVSGWGGFEKRSVGVQLVDAADSIGSNIAEAYGRYHFKDRLNFLYYARGSLYETDTRWRKAQRRSLIKKPVFDRVVVKIRELAPKLNNYIQSKREQGGMGSGGGRHRVCDSNESYDVSEPFEEYSPS